MTADITIIVKTFERPDAIRRLLDSIKAHAPGVPVIVADDSRAPKPEPDADGWLCMPYDSGVSRGRNKALCLVETQYFVLCDDDFVFTDRSDLQMLRAELLRGSYDILGGHIVQVPEQDVAKNPSWYTLDTAGHVLSRDTRTGKYAKTNHTSLRCDFIRNFFIARTASVRRIGGWHDDLKTGEHLPFFLRAQEFGLSVGYTDTISVAHEHIEASDEYVHMRRRAKAFCDKWLDGVGITKVIDKWR